MFIWIGKFGFNFFYTSGRTFARYDPEKGGTIYGPYTLWYEQKFLLIYWAVSKPYKSIGMKIKGVW